MLKVIDVDVAGLEREVRGCPIAELNDLDIQPLRLGFRDQSLDGLRIDIWQHADLDGLGAGGRRREEPKCGNECVDAKLHAMCSHSL